MTALLKTTQIQEPSSAIVNLTLDSSGGVTNGGTSTLVAGTTSVAPIKFTSGTNLTSASAGALEYDGKVIYGTPQGSQRGVILDAQYYRLNSDLAGANVSTAQSIFGVGVTLSASTVYTFETTVILIKSAGTTSHNISFGFGGTATVNNILYELYTGGINQAALPVVTDTFSYSTISTASATAITGAITTANRIQSTRIFGTVSINAGGTFIPQYTVSNAPGGAYSTVAGCYFNIYPIGASGANTSVGTWA
jgi:hypothetical protein